MKSVRRTFFTDGIAKAPWFHPQHEWRLRTIRPVTEPTVTIPLIGRKRVRDLLNGVPAVSARLVGIHQEMAHYHRGKGEAVERLHGPEHPDHRRFRFHHPIPGSSPCWSRSRQDG